MKVKKKKVNDNLYTVITVFMLLVYWFHHTELAEEKAGTVKL